MGKFAMILLAGAGTLIAGGAKATDITTTSEYASPELVQQVRLVCDEAGRCYRTGGSRVIIRDSRDSYGYAPRERYIERRTYRDWDDGPRVGIRAPGVSVGVGVDHDRW